MKQYLKLKSHGSNNRYYYDRLSLDKLFKQHPELEATVNDYSEEQRSNTYTFICVFKEKLTRLFYDDNTSIMYLLIEPDFKETINVKRNPFNVDVIKRFAEMGDVIIPVLDLYPARSYDNKPTNDFPIGEPRFSLSKSVEVPDNAPIVNNVQIKDGWYYEFNYSKNTFLDLIKIENIDEVFCIRGFAESGWYTINVKWEHEERGNKTEEHDFRCLTISKESSKADIGLPVMKTGSEGKYTGRINSVHLKKEYLEIVLPVPINPYSKDILVDERWYKFVSGLFTKLIQAERTNDREYFSLLYKLLYDAVESKPNTLDELFKVFKIEE